MKVLIVGGGLIGVTAAYALQCRGHEVTVIEREEGAGRETSFANGGLLTPSMSEPWNPPGCWRVLLGSLGRADAPMQLRLRALPALAGWGLRFLLNSRRSAFERNSLNNLRLALYSLEVLRSWRSQVRIEYAHAARGSLRLFRDPAALETAWQAAARLSDEGVAVRALSRSDTIAIEPALAPIASRLAGAIHYGSDEVGDAHQFCVALAEHCRRQGVGFRFRTRVTTLEMRSGCASAVLCDGERLLADRYVVAAGSYTAPLLERIGVHVPVRPAKGYSITLDASEGVPALNIPVLDDELHAVVVPLGREIRVAGTAEFAGYDRRIDPARIRNLIRLLQAVLPQAQLDSNAPRPWCGLRAMSVDGVPIIGSTPIRNLFVSTGHGHLGWTLATGSAQLLADLLCSAAPAIDPAAYAPTRF